MIPVALILGAGLLVMLRLSPFWKDVVNFAKKTIKKLKAVIKVTLEGCLIVLKRLQGRVVQKRQLNYERTEAGTYKEIVVTEEMLEDEVDEKYKARLASEFEVDISDDLEMQLA